MMFIAGYAISGVHNRRSFSGTRRHDHYVHQTRYACVRRHTGRQYGMVEKISAPTWNALPATYSMIQAVTHPDL